MISHSPVSRSHHTSPATTPRHSTVERVHTPEPGLTAELRSTGSASPRRPVWADPLQGINPCHPDQTLERLAHYREKADMQRRGVHARLDRLVGDSSLKALLMRPPFSRSDYIDLLGQLLDWQKTEDIFGRLDRQVEMLQPEPVPSPRDAQGRGGL